ncbi:MAG TPA: hypothetical protein VES64_01515 [Allosphingosinicella sp.]|nr:hypothetical protein [Allosphingosinicella sp.]
MRSAGAALAAAALLASCAPPPTPPAPAPMPPPAPSPQPQLPEPPPPADWRDGPLSPGDWSYNTDRGAGVAVFMQDGIGVFVVRCAHDRRFSLVRMFVSGGSPLIIRTSFGERTLPTDELALEAGATLPATDPLLDQIVFSRGRFLVRAAGVPDLILPSWPEPARAIEECRAQ